MDFKNLDIKTIFILVLGVALVLMFIFGGDKGSDIDNHEDERKNLQEQNDSLLKSNKDLNNENESLNDELIEITTDISKVDGSLNNNSGNITNLQDEKDKVSDNVRVLNADGVASSLNKYLTRRESKGSN